MKFKFYKSLLLIISLATLHAAPSAGLVDNVLVDDVLQDSTVLVSPTYQTGIDQYGNTTIAFASNDNVPGLHLQATTLFPQVTFVNGTVDNNASIANATINNTNDQILNTNNILPLPYPFTPSLTVLNIDRAFKLCVSLSGNAILVWTQVVNSTSAFGGRVSVLMAAYMPLISAPSTFGPWTVTQLSDTSSTVTDFDAAIDTEGNAVVAWRLSNAIARNSGGLLISTSVVQAAFTDTTAGATPGTWLMATQPGTPAQSPPLAPNVQDFTLSSQDFNVSQTPAVGIAQGNATVAWQISTGNIFTPTNDGRSRLVVQAAFRAKNLGWEVFDSNATGDISPTNPTAVLSTIGLNVSTPPRVTAYANTSVVTWQVVSNRALRNQGFSFPTNNGAFLPANSIQAFVRHF